MPRAARGGPSRLQLRPGSGTVITAAPGCPRRSLPEVSSEDYTGTHLQATGGYETGSIAFCFDIGKFSYATIETSCLNDFLLLLLNYARN